MASNLAPGVMRNLVTHAITMALLPLSVFFLVKWIGFSGTAAAIGMIGVRNLRQFSETEIMRETWNEIIILVAVIMVHLCLARFVYIAWKEVCLYRHFRFENFEYPMWGKGEQK